MGTAGDYLSRTKIGAYFHEARESRKLVLLIVAIALLLDNMLLTTVVPIIPEFLYTIRHQKDQASTTPSLVSPTPPSGVPPFLNESRSRPFRQRPRRTTESPEDILAEDPINYPIEEWADPGSGDWQDYSGSGDAYDDDDNAETTTTLSPEAKKKHSELVKETGEVGVMFASKAVVQLITNPFVGPLTNKIGYSIPMFCGFIIMFFSTLIFAFSRSYIVLFFARALQGVGSSCSSVAGMGMLADRYPDDKERGNAMALALGGLALGVLIGPPFGGFMYEFVGKSAPFLILAFLALLDGCLQLLVLQPGVVKSEEEPATLMTLISDPYILVASGAITFANMGIAMLEPSLPIFMMDRMDASKWQLGAAFLPASISYLIGTNLFGPLGHKMGRWLASFVGIIVIGVALFLVTLANRPNHLIIPMGSLGFGIGMVDSSMMPELGYLVDIRHSAVYGGVYAIGDIAFCMGFAVGPALSGSLVEGIGFRAMLIGMGIICFLYAPLLLLLKNPPSRTEQEKQESTQLVFGNDKTTVKYANFDEELVGGPLGSQQGQSGHDQYRSYSEQQPR